MVVLRPHAWWPLDPAVCRTNCPFPPAPACPATRRVLFESRATVPRRCCFPMVALLGLTGTIPRRLPAGRRTYRWVRRRPPPSQRKERAVRLVHIAERERGATERKSGSTSARGARSRPKQLCLPPRDTPCL